MIKIIDSKNYKYCRSKNYNYNFNKKNGYFERWGNTIKDDPNYAPFPEILDLELSVGDCLGNCKWCYKGNGKSKTYHMNFKTFKKIIDKMSFLTQVAFGITNIKSNKHFFKIMKYTKKKGIIPNYTCHGLDVDKKIAKKTAKLCGAVAVSVYLKDKSYDAIKMFTDEGMSQVNIHFMLAEENYEKAFEIIDDIVKDPRLAKLNAIVFLQYKHKNKSSPYHSISSPEKYKKLVDYCTERKIGFGFDSCSAPLYLKSISDSPDKEKYIQCTDNCEAFLMSSYCNVFGEFFPCSFAEGIKEWKTGINILGVKDFIKDIWYHSRFTEWRKKLLDSSKKCNCEYSTICRSCPIYDEINSCKMSGV